MLALFSSLLIYNKLTTGEFINKDISLKGGLSITLYLQEELDIADIETWLADETDKQINIRRISEPLTNKIQGYTIISEFSETASGQELVDFSVPVRFWFRPVWFHTSVWKSYYYQIPPGVYSRDYPHCRYW